jgi:hypothetical protein
LIAIILFSIAMAGLEQDWDRASRNSPAAYSTAQISKQNNPPRVQRTVRFSGAVSKGQTFVRQLEPNLFFRLVPAELGWTISIGNKTGAEKNFCGVVTPPYRGINAIDIEGWHFRNADNSGTNASGPKNVNAPQEIREFNFVVNDSDYRKGFDALQVLLWPYSFSQQQIDQAQAVHARLPKGNGKLTIRDLKLNTLEAGKQAGIDEMMIDVELNLPQ